MLQPIKGRFSAFSRLREGRYYGEILAEAQELGPCEPGSVTERAGMRQNDHQSWPIFWVRDDDAHLVGRLWYWRDSDNHLCAEAVYGAVQRRKLREDRLLAQWFIPNKVVLEGAWCSIASNWGDDTNYYHWFLDSLTRLSVREQLPEKCRILLPTNGGKFVAETLDLLGLSDETYKTTARSVLPERFYFCSPTAMTGAWNPHGYKWLRAQFAPYFSKRIVGRHIFLTRRGTNRVPQNIENVEQAFKSRGFEIIDCGEHSVRQQIEIVSSASMIAGVHGAAMTNILWAAKETPVLELFYARHFNACYELIAAHGELCYEYCSVEEENVFEAIENWIDSADPAKGNRNKQ